MEREESMTEDELAAAFEEWKRRYDEDPSEFMSFSAFKGDEPASYGRGSAQYFLSIVEDLKQGARHG